MNSDLYQSGVNTLTAIGGIAGVGLIIILFLYFMTKKWFWLISAGISGLASAYFTLICIIDSRFLGALIFTFLTWVCWTLTEIAIKHLPRNEKQG